VSEPTNAALPTLAQATKIRPASERLDLIKSSLDANEPAIRASLGRFMSSERFGRMVLTLMRANVDLQKCKPASIVLSALRIAQLQLSPDPALGQSWLIPREVSVKDRKGDWQKEWRAEFQIGYKGYLALAYRSPLVGAVRYGVVRKGDRFAFEDGRNWRLEHEPSVEGWPESPGETVAAWAVLDLRSGFSIPRVMYLPEILRHKARGKGKQPAWQSDFAAMCAKTVLGDACRRGPFEGEIGRAFSDDHSGEIGEGQGDDGAVIDVEHTETTQGNGRVAEFKRAFSPTPAAMPSVHETANDETAQEETEEDFLGDALDVDSEIPPEASNAESAALVEALKDSLGAPHVGRILSAGRAVGLKDEDELNAVIGANVRACIPEFEAEALRKIKAWSKKK
jgi:recombination protein RecT